MSIADSATLTALTQTLRFTERRHSVLASNLANMDTPGYQTADLSVDSFQRALSDQYASGRVQRDADDAPIHQVRDAAEQILYHDGSDVSVEQQVTQISKNQALHSTAITLLRHQMSQLQMAIGESINV